MNPKIRKVEEEIERTKAKIAELQELLPELERKKTDMENTEIVRLVRFFNISPVDFATFIGTYKPDNSTAPPISAIRKEGSNIDEE